MYLPEVGEKLKQLRMQHKMTQKALAEQTGVSKSVISSYENGVHLPPYDMLVRLAHIFGVSTDYLLGVPGHKTLRVDGLTDSQIEALSRIVEELRALSMSQRN